MRWRALVLVMAAWMSLGLGDVWAAPVDDVVEVASVRASTKPPEPNLADAALNAATHHIMNSDLWVETDHEGRATFVWRMMITRSRVDLPRAKWAAFTQGARKAFDWCRTLEAEDVSVEKHVGHYTAIGASGKWEGLSLAVAGVRGAGCAVQISGYQHGSGSIKVYVAPRDAVRLGGALASVPATARALRLERARAAAVREQLQ